MYKFPAVRETMVDRAGSRVESSTDSILDRMRHSKRKDNIESSLLPLLPSEIKLIISDQESCKVAKLRYCFLLYTGPGAHPVEPMYSCLVSVNKFLQNHTLLASKAKGKIPDNSLIYYLHHAEVPQIMLEVLHQACYDSDYFQESKSHCIPYLAIQLLTCFIHPSSATFIFQPDKLFSDSLSRLESLADIVAGRALNWFNQFSAAQFFGSASFTPQGKHWLYTHLDTYTVLCSNMAKCGSFINEQIRYGDVYSSDRAIVAQLRTFREGTPRYSARIFGHFVTGQCVYAFVNILQYSHSRYDKFYTVSKAVRAANVLRDFHLVIKQIMSWTDPTHYLLPYLNGVSLCLEMERGFEELLINDIEACRKKDIPVGILSLEYWNQDQGFRRFPSRLAWILVHALCLDNKLGSGWCLHIICWYLERALDKVTFPLIECCGAELMDLAHLVDWDYPTLTRVQGVIIEALLRYAGVSHKDFLGDIHNGTFKKVSELRDFCLEAAVFCKKAQCEQRMTLIVKQKKVGVADRLKEEGNKHFKEARYKEAILSYTDAIATCPLTARTKQAIYYSNRAECHLRLTEYMKAVHDCNRSLCLDRSLKVKVQWRRARAYQKLNLDYGAWLDMKCICEDQTLSKMEEGSADFEDAFTRLSSKLSVMKVDLKTEIMTNNWLTWCLPED